MTPQTSCSFCGIREDAETKIEKAKLDHVTNNKNLPKDFCNIAFVKIKSTGTEERSAITLTECDRRFVKDNPKWRTDLHCIPAGAYYGCEDGKIPLTKTTEDYEKEFVKEYDLLKNYHKLSCDEVSSLVDAYKKDERTLKVDEMVEKLTITNQSDKKKKKKSGNMDVKVKLKEKVLGSLSGAKNVTETKEAKDKIYKDLCEILDDGIDLRMIRSPDYNTYINRKGRAHAEAHVRKQLVNALNGGKSGKGPAFLLAGFSVWKNLKDCFLPQPKKNKQAGPVNPMMRLTHANCASKETEHDVMLTIPSDQKIQVNFFQVKNPNVRPWLENKEHSVGEDKKQIEKAFSQTVKDVQTFLELLPELTKEELEKIELNCSVVLPFSDYCDVGSLCKKCRKIILVKEDIDKVESLFDNKLLSNCSMITDDKILNLYKKLGSRYFGIGSLVPMKTVGEYFTRINDQIEKVKRETETETALFLTSEEKDALQKIQSLLIRGPFGSGKTWILLLGISRAIENCKRNGRKLKVLLVSWEESTELLKIFDKFKSTYNEDSIDITVMSKKRVLEKYGISDTDNRVQMVNILCAKACKKFHDDYTQVIVAIDEMTPTTHSDPSTTPLEVFKSLFNESGYGDWSRLKPGEVVLMMSLQPVRTQNDLTVTLGKVTLLSFIHMPKPIIEFKGPDQMKLVTLKRTFRTTKMIHRLLKRLHTPRVPDVQETCNRMFTFGRYDDTIASCIMQPDDEEDGHDVDGEVSLWIVLERCSHAFCRNVIDCTLDPFKQTLVDLINDQRDRLGFGSEQIAIVFDTGRGLSSRHMSDKSNNSDSKVKKWIQILLAQNKQESIKVSTIEEFVGAECPSIIFLYLREEVSLKEKYNGWSRASTNLTIITDNTYTPTYFQLQSAVSVEGGREQVLRMKQKFRSDIPPEDVTVIPAGRIRKMTSTIELVIQRLSRPVYGRNNIASFLAYLFLLIVSLPISPLALGLSIFLSRRGFCQPLADLATYSTYITTIGGSLVWMFLFLLYSGQDMLVIFYSSILSIMIIGAYVAQYFTGLLGKSFFSVMVLVYLGNFLTIATSVGFMDHLFFCMMSNMAYAVLMMSHPVYRRWRHGGGGERMERSNFGLETLDLLGRAVMALVFLAFHFLGLEFDIR